MALICSPNAPLSVNSQFALGLVWCDGAHGGCFISAGDVTGEAADCKEKWKTMAVSITEHSANKASLHWRTFNKPERFILIYFFFQTGMTLFLLWNTIGEILKIYAGSSCVFLRRNKVIWVLSSRKLKTYHIYCCL